MMPTQIADFRGLRSFAVLGAVPLGPEAVASGSIHF